LLLRLDGARDLAAAFDLELAIGNRARNMAGGADQQPLADDKLALEMPAHLGLLDRGVAFEQAALGDVQLAALVQFRLDAALDHEPVTAADVPGQRDFPAYDHVPALDLLQLRRVGRL